MKLKTLKNLVNELSTQDVRMWQAFDEHNILENVYCIHLKNADEHGITFHKTENGNFSVSIEDLKSDIEDCYASFIITKQDYPKLHNKLDFLYEYVSSNYQSTLYKDYLTQHIKDAVTKLGKL